MTTGSATLSQDCRTLTLSVPRHKRLVTTVYRVQDLRPDPRAASVAFRLTKPSGEAYDVAQEWYGPTCTCQDATYRQRACKHIRAAQAVGLLPQGRR